MNEEDNECTSLFQVDDRKLSVHDEANTEELRAQLGTETEKIQEGEYSWMCKVCEKITKGVQLK